MACPSCFTFPRRGDCTECSAEFFANIETYKDFCDATAFSLQGALAPWNQIYGYGVTNSFLSSMAALNRQGFLTAAFQEGGRRGQRQWIHGWLPR